MLSQRGETVQTPALQGNLAFPVFLRVIRETCLPLLCKVSALRVIAFMYPLMGLSVGRVIGIEILPLLMAVSRCIDWT